MQVGIGLPVTIPGVEREQVLDWARRAEARGFSSLGTIDRLVYPNWEPLLSLAAAAAVTERIGLATTILLAPARGNGALIAKEAATLHRLSNGRLTLGVAPGAREDDFEVSGTDYGTRGRRFDEMLELWKRIWAGEELGMAGGIGPEPPGGAPTLIVGGRADAAFERAARYGDGWMMGGGSPDDFPELVEKLRAAWGEAGREGSPRTMALAYYALGDRGREAADRYLRHYYGHMGDVADAIAGSAATDPDTVNQYIQAFADRGCDEFILFPCDPDPDQVDLLADAAAAKMAA